MPPHRGGFFELGVPGDEAEPHHRRARPRQPDRASERDPSQALEDRRSPRPADHAHGSPPPPPPPPAPEAEPRPYAASTGPFLRMSASCSSIQSPGSRAVTMRLSP